MAPGIIVKGRFIQHPISYFPMIGELLKQGYGRLRSGGDSKPDR